MTLSAADDRWRTRTMKDDQALDKVRKLLATAESYAEQGFDDAATTFREQATGLLTRYQLDESLLDDGKPQTDEVGLRIFTCTGRFARRHHNLLNAVAHAMGCRTVLYRGHQESPTHVIGFERDLDATELLWTSLMVQAQSELSRAAVIAKAEMNGSWSKDIFTKNFLDAYRRTIYNRLVKDRDAAVKVIETETDSSLLPVLRDRKARVDEFMDHSYGKLRNLKSTGSRSSYHGFREGAAAGKRAALRGASLPTAPRQLERGA